MTKELRSITTYNRLEIGAHSSCRFSQQYRRETSYHIIDLLDGVGVLVGSGEGVV